MRVYVRLAIFTTYTLVFQQNPSHYCTVLRIHIWKTSVTFIVKTWDDMFKVARLT